MVLVRGRVLVIRKKADGLWSLPGGSAPWPSTRRRRRCSTDGAPVIVSASRRTDLPAFYSTWFLNRLAAGYALVRHPMNPRRVRRVPLIPPEAGFIVFWTRDPRPLLPGLSRLEEAGLGFSFLFTVTPYGADLEAGLPPLEQRLAAFIALAERIGPERVDWRYDPILFTGWLDAGFHREAFGRLAARLRGHTRRCIVSYLEPYAKTRRNLAGTPLRAPGPEERAALLGELAELADGCGMRLQTCALEDAPQLAGACIDGERIARLPDRRRDTGQRALCRCTRSVDIGAYDTCLHGCRYCYATGSARAAAQRHALHDPASPLLVGTLQPGDRVVG